MSTLARRDVLKLGAAALMACRNIKEHQFISARTIIGNSGLHGIAGVHQVHKIDALNNAAVLHIKAGNYTFS